MDLEWITDISIPNNSIENNDTLWEDNELYNNDVVDLAFKILLCTILVFGLVGNLAFFLVLIRVLDMRTTINYYLANLAIVDCFTLTIGILLELRPLIYYRHCLLGATFYFIPLYVSMFTIAIISMERYLVICHPLKSYSSNKKTRALLQLAGVWLYALIFDIPQALPCFYFNDELGEYEIPNSILVASELSIIISFSLVMLIASILNIRIINVIKTPHIRHKGEMTAYKKQVVILLVTTSLSFFILLFPEMVFHLLLILLDQEGVINFYSGKTAVAIRFVARSLMFLNSAVNPIIYNIFSQRYRRAFKAAFTNWHGLTIIVKPSRTSRRGTLLTSVNYGRDSKKKASISSSPVPTNRLKTYTSPEKELLQSPNVFKDCSL